MPLCSIFYHSLNQFFFLQMLGCLKCLQFQGRMGRKSDYGLAIFALCVLYINATKQNFQSLLLGKRHASLLPWKLHRRRSDLVLSSWDEKRVSE